MKNRIIIILILLVTVYINFSCTDTKIEGYNILENSEIEYIYNNNDKVIALKINLNIPQKIINKQIFILSNPPIKINLNNNNDTIIFNKQYVYKKLFSNTRIIPFEKLKTKLITIDSLELSSIYISFYKPQRKKKINLDVVSIINKKQFNKFYSNYPKLTKNNLPIIKISTYSDIETVNKKGEIKIFDSNNLSESLELGSNYIGNCKIKVRGQSSKDFPKKNFKLTLTDTVNRDLKLLGLPKEHTWALHGPYMDISLMRNALSYSLYEEMGHYSPRTKFCELVINNEYLGIYVLTELIKPGKNRVNTKANNKKFSSYIVKLDKGKGAIFNSVFRSEIKTGSYQYYHPVYPKKKKITPEEIEYIKTDIHAFENSLLQKNNGYLNHIDLNSFIDFFIINELTKNIDAYRLSTFLHVNNGSYINIGPIWDFNFTFGLNKNNNGYKTDEWIYNKKNIPFWWKELLKKKEFKTALLVRWKSLRNNEFKTKKIIAKINNYYNELSKSEERNFIRWDVFDDELGTRANRVNSYKEEKLLIEEWTKKRLLFIDKFLSKL